MVAAAFYPIEDIVHSVAGDSVDIVTLVPPGQEAHEYEPTARQIGNLQSAEDVFFLGDGFQPDVEKAVASLDAARKSRELDGKKHWERRLRQSEARGAPTGQIAFR